MSEEIIIVDKNDEVIGYKLRQDIKLGDIYRVAALWLTNSKGEILLAQRALDKQFHPGKWGPAVAGTVAKGETYQDNIIKEAFEEIGLKNITFTAGPKKFNDNSQGHFISHFTQWYLVTIDKKVQDFIVEPKEVIAIHWFTKTEIAQKLAKEPDFFIPNMPYYFQLFK